MTTAAPNALTLVGAGLTLVLSRPGDNPPNHPREQVELPELERTANGAINRDGPSYRPPHLWDCSFQGLSQTQWHHLLVLHSLWRDTGTPVLVYDTATPYVEATRTRAIAPGYSTSTVGGRVLYYAQFRAEFQGDIRTQSQGRGWYSVAFRLFETTIVPA